jgi:hypothetical protein
MKIIWHMFFQLSAFNKPMSLVSGVRFQVSEKNDRMRILIILNVIRFLTLTPDPPPAGHLKPVWLKEKIDRSPA